MAERLAIPKQNLHNLLQLAELPDEVVSAFADPGDLKVRHGMRLSPLLKDDRYRDAILAEAALIIAEQEKLQATGADKIEGSKVCERSEEHTSELQSLMRISYAVFCLKKKNKQER